MKNLIFKIMAMTILLNMAGCAGNSNPESWNAEKLNSWFEKGEWLNGWQVKPDQSVDRKAFAAAYFKNKEKWDKAFGFLKDNDLTKLDLKRYDIDGDNLYATVSQYLTKNEADARYESHQKYIDIQYVARGKEIIEVAPASQKLSVLEQYDPAKDIEFMTVTNGVKLNASPEKFFIFFPSDLHEPGLKDVVNDTVRKVVVKVRVD